MAACSIGGASSIKVFAFCSDFGKADRTKGISLERFSGPRLAPLRHEPVHVAGLAGRTKRSTNSFLASCGSLSGRKDTEEDISVEKKERRVPDSSEVESLLTTVCDTASIAEFKLNLAGFRLYVKRDLVDKDIPQPASTLPVIQDNTSNQTPDLNGSASTTSLAIMNPKSPSGGIQNILNTASDEGLVILQSPKVGFFRRSRTIKGKRAPPSCKEKQQVKEGQVLCFIEQLGGNIPIESDVSGEVVKILRKDGEPVGYGDALIAILPSFPGIKKLQ